MGKKRQSASGYKTGDIVWARMPLPIHELMQIEESHRIRPYYLVAKVEDKGYYAMKGTSEEHLDEYENGLLRVQNMDRTFKERTSIDLINCVFLPIQNIKKIYSKLNFEDKNEYYKKMKRNIEIYEYPKEVKEAVEKEKTYFTNNDVVTLKDKEGLYLILNINPGTERARLAKVYTVPKKNTYEIELNGVKYYIDINIVIELGLEELVYSTSFRRIADKDMLYNKEYKEDRNSTKLSEVEIGSVLNYFLNGYQYKMIILDRCNGLVRIKFGLANDRFVNYYDSVISEDTEFEFYVDNVLASSRMKKLYTEEEKEGYSLRKIPKY